MYGAVSSVEFTEATVKILFQDHTWIRSYRKQASPQYGYTATQIGPAVSAEREWHTCVQARARRLSADFVGREYSELVTDDPMGLQLTPIRAPTLVTVADEVEDQTLRGAETEIEAQVNEEYEGDPESEDEASVANSEDEFGPDVLNIEVNIARVIRG